MSRLTCIYSILIFRLYSVHTQVFHISYILNTHTTPGNLGSCSNLTEPFRVGVFSVGIHTKPSLARFPVRKLLVTNHGSRCVDYPIRTGVALTRDSAPFPLWVWSGAKVSLTNDSAVDYARTVLCCCCSLSLPPRSNLSLSLPFHSLFFSLFAQPLNHALFYFIFYFIFFFAPKKGLKKILKKYALTLIFIYLILKLF